MKVLTANRLAPGEVVYWSGPAGWQTDLQRAEVMEDAAVEDALKAAAEWVRRCEMVAPYRIPGAAGEWRDPSGERPRNDPREGSQRAPGPREAGRLTCTAMTNFDARLVRERAEQFRTQVARRLSGELTEDEFKPLRLQNGLYLQLHSYMLRIAIPYGTLSTAQLRKLGSDRAAV